MDLLGFKRRALGHHACDNWGGTSSNEGSSNTTNTGVGGGANGANIGGGGSSLGNISSGSSVQSYTYDGASFVQDAVVAGTAPGADPNSTVTSLASLSGVGSASTAPVVSSETKLRGTLTVGRTVLTLGQMAAGGPVGFISGLISLIQQGLNGDYKALGFGSAPPNTNVSAGSGAATAAAAWSGGPDGWSGGSRSSSSSYGSPVIGYQGAIVNQAISPAYASANLSTPATAAKAQPQGVVITSQQPTGGSPWAGVLLALGAVALMS